MLLYLIISIIATLIFFRIFQNIILNNAKRHSNPNSQNRKVPMPPKRLERGFPHGSLRSFKDRPIVTKMECEGSSAYNRTCKFNNICYSPKTDRFFALTVDEKGLKRRWMNENDNRLLDLTTIDDHNVFYFEFDEDPGNALGELERVDMLYISVSKKTFIFSRFVYNNIMHNIHDDFIGQYVMHRKDSDQLEMNMDNFIFFADGQVENPNDHLFATLSEHPFMYREDFKKSQPNSPPLCFENAVVGNSKEGIWYDYGFYDEPQGPISKKRLSGKYAKEAADFLRKYYEISPPSKPEVKAILRKMSTKRTQIGHIISKNFYISIFSRKQDRLLLNENDLKDVMERTYGLQVRLVQMENLNFSEIVEIMTNTIVSIGLHGAALVFAMFMPENSILIELFPYGVPGENYSPYRTLSWLPGIDLSYKMWLNRNVTMNYSQLGVRKKFDHLTPEGFLSIISLKTVPPHICCGNLPWTVRIYQDTIANIAEIDALIKEGISESLADISDSKKRAKRTLDLLEASRHRIKTITATQHVQKSFAGSDKITMIQLSIKWENPWETMTMNIVPSRYGVWVEEMMEEVIVQGPNLIIEACAAGSEFNIWIRPYKFDKDSKKDYPAAVYSRKFTLKCE